MRDWLGRVIQILLLAGLPSLLAGFAWNAAAGFGLFSAVLLLLLTTQFRYQAALMRWLAHPDLEHVPNATGAWEDVFSKLYRMVKRDKQQQQALTDALLRFREAGEAMPDGVTVLDEDDHIEWLNPMSERHFGIDPQARPPAGDHQPVAPAQLRRVPRRAELQRAADPEGIGEPDACSSIQLVPYGESKSCCSRATSRAGNASRPCAATSSPTSRTSCARRSP